jgi:hypothetical protein
MNNQNLALNRFSDSLWSIKLLLIYTFTFELVNEHFAIRPHSIQTVKSLFPKNSPIKDFTKKHLKTIPSKNSHRSRHRQRMDMMIQKVTKLIWFLTIHLDGFPQFYSGNERKSQKLMTFENLATPFKKLPRKYLGQSKFPFQNVERRSFTWNLQCKGRMSVPV